MNKMCTTESSDKEITRVIIENGESTVLDGDDSLLLETTIVLDSHESGDALGKTSSRGLERSSTSKQRRRLRGGAGAPPPMDSNLGAPAAASTANDAAALADAVNQGGPQADGAAAEGDAAAAAAAAGAGEPSLAAVSTATRGAAGAPGAAEGAAVEVKPEFAIGLDPDNLGTTGDLRIDQLFKSTITSMKEAFQELRDRHDNYEHQIKLFASDHLKLLARHYFSVESKMRVTQEEICRLHQALVLKNDQLNQSRRESQELRARLNEAEARSMQHLQQQGTIRSPGLPAYSPTGNTPPSSTNNDSSHNSSGLRSSDGSELANISIEEHKVLLADIVKLEKTIDCLEMENFEIRQENVKMTETRKDYVNKVQRALLKGVSSLNNEALKVLNCTPIKPDPDAVEEDQPQPQPSTSRRQKSPTPGPSTTTGAVRKSGRNGKKYPDCGMTEHGFIKGLCESSSEASELGRPTPRRSMRIRASQGGSAPPPCGSGNQQARRNPVLVLNHKDATDCGIIKPQGCSDSKKRRRGDDDNNADEPGRNGFDCFGDASKTKKKSSRNDRDDDDRDCGSRYNLRKK